MSAEEADLPVLGWTQPWPDRAAMRVLSIENLSTVDQRGKVKGPQAPLPYATITAELGTNESLAALLDHDFGDESGASPLPLVEVPVGHREDYKALYWLFFVAGLNQGILSGSIEVIVQYERPSGFFGSTQPTMTVEAFESGYWLPMLRAIGRQGDWPSVQPFFHHERGPFKWPR